ncbi:MAG: hypothetical protein Q6373_005580 [Candidatus Sigynarchaeota archaeon]
MSWTKVKISVLAGCVPIIAALVLILLPFISYLAWVVQVLVFPGIPRDPTGPSTVLDFLGSQSGYMFVGIILAFIGFPVFNECIKNMKREAQDHAFLLEELRALDITGTVLAGNVEKLNNRDLVYHINCFHASAIMNATQEDLLCFECGAPITARQNQQFHASCPDCHYLKKGAIAYLKAAGLTCMAILIGLLAIVIGIAWIWWIVLAFGMLALGTFAWGHYLRASKPRV